MENKKKILIIGATGSVGCAAVEVVLANPDLFSVEGLVAKNSYKKLAEQGVKLNSKYALIENESHFQVLQEELKSTKIKVIAGRENIVNFIKSCEAERILIASSGAESIYYLQAALLANKDIAIANKESIVCAGSLFSECKKNFTGKIIPVDSEHSAIFQTLENSNLANIHNIILTSSGGPFYYYSETKLKSVTKAQALKHPKWQMGAKISIDSATFMNKALEVLEACYLFNLPAEKINVIIERSCTMHGGVSYNDGSMLANLSKPSMKISTGYGLTYPKRQTSTVQPLNLLNTSLVFEKPNPYQQKIIAIAKEVFEQGGNYPLIFNTANEIAVEAFLNDRISFTKILYMIQYSLEKLEFLQIQNLEDVIINYNIIKNKISNYITHN
ncbi:1-deoxy-D-xylulose 5-phosphate reductoisomerase [Candidatus Hepatincola sp. Av]